MVSKHNKDKCKEEWTKVIYTFSPPLSPFPPVLPSLSLILSTPSIFIISSPLSLYTSFLPLPFLFLPLTLEFSFLPSFFLFLFYLIFSYFLSSSVSFHLPSLPFPSPLLSFSLPSTNVINLSLHLPFFTFFLQNVPFFLFSYS